MGDVQESALAFLQERSVSGKSLPHQELKSMWANGGISADMDEERIQQSSIEPALSDEAYCIRTDVAGGFRPQAGIAIRDLLDQLPPHSCQKVDIKGGHEIHPGETWLVRCKEKIRLCKGEYVKASAKSSAGRVFLYVRLLSDAAGTFDEIVHTHDGCDDAQLWILIQPLVFHHIIAPDVTLLQLRFFSGDDAMISDTELKKLHMLGEPLILTDEPVVLEGVQLHLDLEGADSNGIVGLKARPTHSPVDMRKKHVLDPRIFFEPIASENGKYILRRGEHCLFMTEETLQTPHYLNAELSAHWGGGFAGPKHFAGFIDNGFSRPLVLEVRSDEVDDVELVHGMPIGKLHYYWTGLSEKLYGQEAGSNYSKQSGPQPSKHFKPFDWDNIKS